MSSKSNNSLQILVDCFDDIPNIMTKMNESINNSPTRYKATGRNSSFAVDGVMRGNKRVDITKRENAHRVERMATQALRVLDNLSKLPNQKRQTRPLTETAAIAQSKLKSLVDSGIDIQKFYQQYDVNRSGKVSYKDFCDTLGAVSSGLGREEAHELARQLDSRRVGLIEYNNILTSLQQIRKDAAYKDASSGQAAPKERRQPVQAWAEDTQKSASQEQEQPQQQSQQREPHTTNQESQSQKEQHQEQYSHFASSETKSETPVEPSSNNNTQKVAPRTSFEYIAPASDGNLSPNSPADLSSPHNHHSRPGTPEAEARMSIARRYFYNPEVNYLVYGEQARHTPFDFDRHHYQQEQAHPHRAHRRRCNSAPSRARRSNFGDSGCNVAPTAEVIHFDELAHFSPTMRVLSDSLKFSNGSLTAQIPEDPALTARIEANPFYLAREHHEQKTEERKQHAAKTVESAIVDQISGGVANLRHTLRSFDASKSGTLNNDELRGALKKAGVKLSNEQYGALYQALATTRTSSNTPGYSRGQVVSIDNLADRLQAHTVATRPPNTAPASSFEALYALPRVYGEEANKAEKVRVMKKVLQSASKLTNPHAIYKHIDPQHNGYLNEPQLQDALLYMGANLSPKEFTVLVNNVPKDVDGRIEIAQFERNLRDQVRQQEHKEDLQTGEIKQHFRRYSGTFKSSENFQLAQENHEFEPLCHKKGLLVPAENDKRWNQLKEVFQTHPEVVRTAFSVPKPSSPERKPLHNKNNHSVFEPVEVDTDFTKSLSVHELKQHLAQSGLPLSTDDVLKVEKSLRRAAHQRGESGDNAVTLERFCEVVGIEVSKRDKHRVALNDHDRNLDGGVFAESLKSLHGNNNVATTFYSGGSTSSSDAHPVTGDRRRRAPSASRGTASDPSSFWQLADTDYSCTGLTQLFPSPMPTFRSSNVHDTAKGALVLDPTAATRGVVKLQPTQGFAQLYNNIQHDANLQGTEQESRGRAHFTSQSNQQSSRRAQSAPARSRSLLGRTTTMPRNNTSAGVSAALSGHAGDGNNISVAHGGFTGTDTYRASAHSHPQQQADNNSVGNSTSHTNTTSNTNNTTSTAHSTTNSAVYLQASMAEKIARWAPQVSDYYKSKEKLSLGGASSVQDDSVPQRARSSLRRQFLKANQSYMQGASAAGVVTKSNNSVSSVSASNNAPFATYATYE